MVTRHSLVLLMLLTGGVGLGSAQQPSSASRASQKPPELPAQIELLETRVRFEDNGDSRKEVHARVHINNELGVPQFAHLNFDYNRGFQQIEIPQIGRASCRERV